VRTTLLVGAAVLGILPTGGSAGMTPATSAVSIEMRHVHLRLTDDLAVDIESLHGELVSLQPGRIVDFDDSRSYVVRAHAARMSIDMPALTILMNRYAFGYPGAPLSNIGVHAGEAGKLTMSAKLHKGLTIPVSLVATPGVTSDGRLRLQVESVKATGVPVKGLLGLFGAKLGSVMSLDPRRGMRVSGNDIEIAQSDILPPPRMTGPLTRVQIEGGRLIETIGDPDAQAGRPEGPADSRAHNYIYFHGSSLRFGKLTMTGTDLQLIDQDERTPFDFFPARYNSQLVAGYSKNTPAHGLRTYMPDFAAVANSKY
jgi:hypothetical protein